MSPSPVHSRRTLLIASVGVIALAAEAPVQAFEFARWWGRGVTGSGRVVDETRKLGRFQGLRLNTRARVVIRPSDHHGVQVRAEENVVELIESRVEEGVLVVEDRQRFSSAAAEVVVSVRYLSSIRSGGATAVLAEGLSTPLLALSMGGSSVVTLKAISAGRLAATLGGASALHVSGNTNQLVLQLGGSADVRAAELEADSVSVASGGSSSATVWAKDDLRATTGGSSSLRYRGRAQTTIATSGSSTVRPIDGAASADPRR